MTCLDLAIAEALSPYRYMAVFCFGLTLGLVLTLVLDFIVAGRRAQE